MQKKMFIIPLMILIISFSAGIFTQIVIPIEGTSLTQDLPSVGTGILDYLKNDMITVCAALLFSCSVFLLPLVPCIVIGKTFSLGFSAAYLLASSAKNAFVLTSCVLLPRGLFKIPVYVALTIISIETAVFVKKNYQNPSALKHGMPRFLLQFLCCLACLICSSVLEAVLLLGVLSP